MGFEDQVAQWFAGLANIAVGFLLGSIITGWFTLKVLIPRVMKNQDVQELLQLFREAKIYLKEITENQKNNSGKE